LHRRVQKKIRDKAKHLPHLESLLKEFIRQQRPETLFFSFDLISRQTSFLSFTIKAIKTKEMMNYFL
jgi:hypothetical protein